MIQKNNYDYELETNQLVTSNVLDFVITTYKEAARARKKDIEQYR